MGRDSLKTYTRSEAVTIFEVALNEFEWDHEEFTGVSNIYRMDLSAWWGEIRNLIENKY